jgi:phycocyanobilin lyase beta subunit
MKDAQALTLIRAVEEADSSARLLEAVQELADARLEAAIPTLIAALGYNNPGAAVAAVDGLVQIGEAAVPSLLEQIDGYNYGARAWAIRALVGIRDPRGLETLLDAARTDFAMSVRRAAVKGLGILRWHQLPPDQIQSAQAQALETLLLVSQDPEWIVRYATVVGLQALAAAVSTTRPDWLLQIQAHLEHLAAIDENLTVRARTWLAQQQLQEMLAVTQLQESRYEPAGSLEADWHLTLERVYNRKSQERSLVDEGDPRKFREVAAAIAEGRLKAVRPKGNNPNTPYLTE